MSESTLARRNKHLYRNLRGALAISLSLTVAASGALFIKHVRAAARSQDSPQATQAVFTNPAPVTIDDDAPATPYPSTINVSGLAGVISAAPGSVKVTLHNFSHTFPDDVGIVLVSPTGAALDIQDGVGDEPEVTNVTYTISDTGAGVLPNLDAWGTGTYKPTNYYADPFDEFPSPGPGTAYNNPGPAGDGTATFSSTFGGMNPNGIWRLYITDFSKSDAGMISGGWSLEITTTVQANRTPLDFDGDQKTDYAVVRNNGGALTWFIQRSTAGFTAQQFGSAGDQLVPGDYDGDGKWDIAVWRSGIFFILRSSDSTVQAVSFGLSGDDPRITADFDNDGKADPAVVRNNGGALTWYMQRSTAGFASATFGSAATDVPIRGDFDGDGKADVAVYRNSTGTPANTFFVLRSSDGAVQAATFGLSTTDYVIPGDYDGDAKTDYAVWRGKAGGNGVWYWLNSSDGSFHATPFGTANLDKPVPGDYDGDGKTDLAVWRPGTPSIFFVNGTTSGVTGYSFGLTGDLVPASTLQAR